MLEKCMVTLNTSGAGLWGRDVAGRQALITGLVEKHGVIVTRKQVLAFAASVGKTNADVRFLFNNKMFRAGRGQYTLQPLLVDDSATSASSVA
jgi:hypothetical protein